MLRQFVPLFRPARDQGCGGGGGGWVGDELLNRSYRNAWWMTMAIVTEVYGFVNICFYM